MSERASELVTFKRSKVRWKYERKLQSFLDRITDQMLDRTSCRASRQENVKCLSSSERTELQSQLRDKKWAREGHKNVVFFGDGTFSCTQRAHVSIPKKRLLKHLAIKGLVFLLCERYTSKRCPCGHSELDDGIHAGGKRVRVHKTTGDVCAVLHAINDRDELACVNMLMAVSSCINHTTWPEHLRR